MFVLLLERQKADKNVRLLLFANNVDINKEPVSGTIIFIINQTGMSQEHIDFSVPQIRMFSHAPSLTVCVSIGPKFT